MTRLATIQCSLPFRTPRPRRKPVPASPLNQSVEAGRVPRIARLMALALRFEELLRTSRVRNYAELARLGHVSRARISQIMNLRLLAPDIQEQILFLRATRRGRDPIHLGHVRSIATILDWQIQRSRWTALLQRRSCSIPLEKSLENRPRGLEVLPPAR